MPPIENIIAVALAGFFLSITPGPSMLYVLSRSVGQSRAAGLASAFGLAMGGMVLAIATSLGLARLFAQLPELMVILRYIGSVYLVWLGVTMILSARIDAQMALKAQQTTPHSLGRIIWQGLLVEVLNPKTVLFFALFLPPFVDVAMAQSQQSSVETQLLLLGILVPLTAIPSDALIALMGGTLAQRINRGRKFREGLAWFGGLTLIAIALNLHTGLL